MGRYEEALVDYNKAISIDPELANAYANRAIAYSHLESMKKQSRDYEKCLQLDPKIDNPPGFFNGCSATRLTRSEGSASTWST